MGRRRETSEARQRILQTADRLFYADGIRAVGIDRIIAEAAVAKMSLYKHFPSKDDLILAVLQHREASFQTDFEESMQKHTKKIKDPVKVFFAALKDWIETPTFRGCAFINASVELADCKHPAFAFARSHKQRFGEYLRQYVEQAVGKSAAAVAPAIGLLIEGAIVTAVIQGDSSAVDVAREAAEKLLAATKKL